MSKHIKRIDRTVGAFEKTITALEAQAEKARAEAESHAEEINRRYVLRHDHLNAADKATTFASNLRKLLGA